MPGSGTFGMEAVARQFATGKKCLVIRNGWFSYPLDADLRHGRDSRRSRPCSRRAATGRRRQAPFAPAADRRSRGRHRARRSRDVVFAPHVETASGIILPDDYLRAVADAVHAVGGLFVLDCIASGAMWVDMDAIGVDVLISAPQKGWSASPCCALVMLSERARTAIDAHHQHQLRLRPEQVAADHGGLREAAATPTTPPCPPMR